MKLSGTIRVTTPRHGAPIALRYRGAGPRTAFFTSQPTGWSRADARANATRNQAIIDARDARKSKFAKLRRI